MMSDPHGPYQNTAVVTESLGRRSHSYSVVKSILRGIGRHYGGCSVASRRDYVFGSEAETFHSRKHVLSSCWGTARG